MSRPETTADVTDRMASIGYLDIGKLAHDPLLVTHYASFTRAILANRGTLIPSVYAENRIEIELPKTQSALTATLRHEQALWDERNTDYQRSLETGEPPDQDWRKTYLTEWCASEGLALPWATEEAS